MWQSSGLGSGRTPRDRSSNAGSRPGSAVKRLNLELNFETRSGRSTPSGAVPSLRDEFYGSGGGRGVSATVGPPTPDERGVIVAPHPSDPTAVTASRSKEARDANPDRLDLDRRELSQCPELIDEHRLRLLNYQHNAITRISRLETVRNLVFLDLYANAVEKIAGLECVPQLRVLMLGRNRIRSIGAGLARLTRLDVLDLHNNEIASTSGLNSLASLRILNLAGNRLVSLGDLGNMTGLHELNARRNEIGDLARRGGARGDLVDPRIFPEPRLPPNLRRIFLSHNKIAAACHVAPLRDLGYLEELALDGCPVDARPGYRTDVVDAVSPAVRVLDGAPVTDDDRQGVDPFPSVSVPTGGSEGGSGVGSGVGSGKTSPGLTALERARRALESRRAAAAAVPARTSVVNIGLGPGDDDDEDDEGVSDGSYSDGEVAPPPGGTREDLVRRVLRATEESAATAAAEEEGTAAASTTAAAAIARPSSQDRPRGARELVSSSRSRRADFDEDTRTLTYNGPVALPLDKFPYAPRAETLVFRDFTDGAQLRTATKVARRCCARASNLRFKDCALAALDFVDDLAECAFPGLLSLAVEQGDGVKGSILASALLTPYVARRLPSVVTLGGAAVTETDRDAGDEIFAGVDAVLSDAFDAFGGVGFPVRRGKGHLGSCRSDAGTRKGGSGGNGSSRGNGAPDEGSDPDGFDALETAAVTDFVRDGVCGHALTIANRLRELEETWDDAVKAEVQEMLEKHREDMKRGETPGEL